MDWRVELQQLREVLPSYAPQDYWSISYGRVSEDNNEYPSRKIAEISGNSNNGGIGVYSGNLSQPLPDLPSNQSSPILGCAMPDEIRSRS